jgi:hypothetical protein
VALAIMTLAFAGTTLVTTKAWDPIPTVNAWWASFSALSKPAPSWSARIGGAPDSAAVMRSGQVVVTNRGYVEGYSRDKGELLWRHDVHWALPPPTSWWPGRRAPGPLSGTRLPVAVHGQGRMLV